MYTLEVPMFSASLEELLAVHGRGDSRVVLYGSLPDSPLNGGRPNFLLDGVDPEVNALIQSAGELPVVQVVLDSPSIFSEAHLERARAGFFARVEESNRHGIPFYLASTNLSIGPEELVDVKTEVFHRLVGIGERHGVRNGAIVASATLERHLRSRFAGRLSYVASCTKYYEKETKLSPEATLPRYLADAERYDLVVLTPQDSECTEVLTAVCGKHAERFAAVVDVLCDRTCNSYHHYELVSRCNKVSLAESGLSGLIPYGLEYAKLDCPVAGGRSRARSLEERVPLQLAAGVTHFKLGRSFSADMTSSFGHLVRALDRARQEPTGRVPPRGRETGG